MGSLLNGKQRSSFGSFVTGSSNILAFRTCKAASEGTLPSGTNTVLLYGPSGCGKTHLLEAVEQDIREHDPSRSVLLCSLEGFTGRIIDEVRSNQPAVPPALPAELCSAGVLLIDDLDGLEGKEATQELTAELFNYRAARGLLTMAASVKDPERAFPALCYCMKSAGRDAIRVEIQSPSRDFLCRFVAAVAGEEGISLSEEETDRIIGNGVTGIGEIRGCIGSKAFRDSV